MVRPLRGSVCVAEKRKHNLRGCEKGLISGEVDEIFFLKLVCSSEERKRVRGSVKAAS